MAPPEGDGPAFYRITLKPGPDILRRGVNPLGVLDELRELGATPGHDRPRRSSPRSTSSTPSGAT